MFKKLREKITEEVQQTSLRLPASVQQLTQTSSTDQWLETVKEGSQLSLSPFSGAAASPGEHKRELVAPAPLQDELLVDISDIRPAGHNKDLFSIDEDSHEGSPSKSGFQLVDLSDAEAVTSSEGDGSNGNSQGVAGVTFDPSMSVTTSPALRNRRDSASSSVSDASGLFPIYEVPGVSFNMPQSDLESSSEWEEGGSAAVVERLSKDTVYQAYLKMRQRYHKYKGRYADLARAYKEKEKESEKLRDVLAKTQDKALRKVSELKEQCSLEQQAKAHLEQELRSDLEEKDHKIAALLTKVSGLQEQCLLQKQAKAHLEEELNADLEEKELKISALKMKVTILQESVSGDLASPAVSHNNNNQQQVASGGIALQDEGDNASVCDNSSSTDNTSTAESVSTTDNISMADNVSVASHGSASTTVTASHEAEELIEKLKASVEVEENGDSPDVSKHKSLLARCMDNIRTNKERIGVLMQERDLATSQLQEKIKQIDILKEEHLKELDSLRASMESSALSMAETKKQLFEELQVKEAEAERCKKAAASLETQLEEERSQWQEQLQNKQQELEEKEAIIQELGTNNTTQEDLEEDTEASVAAIKKEVEVKINELESRTQELKESRTDLETQLLQISHVKAQLEDKVLSLTKDKEEISREVEVMTNEKSEVEEKLRTADTVREELEGKVSELENVHAIQKEELQELTNCKLQLEEKIKAITERQLEFEKEVEELRKANSKYVNQTTASSEELMALKEMNEKLTNTLELSQKENSNLIANLEKIEKEKEIISKDVLEKDTTITNLQEKSAELDEKLKHVLRENSSLTEEIARTKSEKELLNKQINENRADADRDKDSLSEELDHLKQENERINNEFNQTKLEKEIENKRLIALEKENEELKSEKDKLNLELTQSKANSSKISEQAFAELTLANEKMDKLMNDWAKQMEEKDTINDELCKKVSDLNEKLVKKSHEYEQKTNEHSQESDEYNNKLEYLRSQLLEKEGKMQECMSKLNILDEENEKLKGQLEKGRNELQTKEMEIESECNNLKKENGELSARVVELEAVIDSHEVELTAVGEEKRKYAVQLETIKIEKNGLQEELQSLKEHIVQVKKEIGDKEENIESLKKETALSQDEYAKVKDEMAKLSETFEAEMRKAKESYAKLKENYHDISKEREEDLAHQKKQNNELKDELSDTRQQLHEMQTSLKQRDEKVEKLLHEKKIMLSELEKKVEDLHNELKEKETLLRVKTDEYESKVEELEAQMSDTEEDLKNKLKNSFQEKHNLEQHVAELSHKLKEKDELAVRQAEEAEQQLTQVQQAFTVEKEELENTWEEKLRCELGQLQKHHEEALVSSSLEVTRSHQAELDGVQSSYQHSIATRDATIAALKDEADQQQLTYQEDLEAWQHKYQDLESQLAEARCQIERLRGLEASLEEAQVQLAAEAAAKCLRMEESLAESPGACAALTAQIDQLQQHNQHLKDTLEQYQKEKEETNKRIAGLEFSNEHSKNKVQNMELSQKELQEKINKLSQDKERLIRQFQEGSSDGVIDDLIKEKEEVEERLTREKEAQMQEYQAKSNDLQEQLEGLVDIRHGYEKQISQIEANNADMHNKIGSVQQERDAARSETLQILAQKQDLEDKFKENLKIKEALKEEIAMYKETISSMKQELEAEKNKVQTMVETINTLQNNILNLQKQVEVLNETCAKLARDLEAESKQRIETEMQLTQMQQLHKQLEEQYGAGEVMLCQLKIEQDKLEASMSALSEAKDRCSELQTHVTEFDSKEKTPLVDRTDSPVDSNVIAEQLAEKMPTNVEQRIKVDEVTRLKAVLGARDEDLSRTRQTIKDLQERLRIAEVISGEVEEHRRRVRELESQLTNAEERHRQQVEAAEQEAARCVAAKEQECLNTISSAYDQQDSETTALVRHHQDALREAQEEVKEKTAKLDAVSQDYINKLKEKDDELCEFVQQYEEQLAKLKTQHEVHIKEVESTWKARMGKMVKQREGEVQQEMDSLKQEWTKERRSPEPQSAESPQELERLTQVAAAAFQSGTESVELLKKQVAAQRRELEDVKLNHGKEVGELKALLELKRRTRGVSGGSGVRLGVSLEEAAEFEYLKNVLYQYMLGKETQTLSKVLCAVVKFDGQQQQEILEREEQRQSLLRSVNGSVHPSLLQEGRSDVSKAL